MAFSSQASSARSTRHKLFESYYHRDDQIYRDQFEEAFGGLFVIKSVQPGDIDPDSSTEYIKALIQRDFIDDASVVVVLVGPNTKCRKHVDWEVSAGLNRKVGGYSGLLGILLPTFPLNAENNYYRSDLPVRLDANVASGYALVYRWDWITASAVNLRAAIDAAFERRRTEVDKIVNASIPQMQRNSCD